MGVKLGLVLLFAASTWSCGAENRDAKILGLSSANEANELPEEPTPPNAPPFETCPDGWSPYMPQPSMDGPSVLEAGTALCKPNFDAEMPRITQTTCPEGWVLEEYVHPADAEDGTRLKDLKWCRPPTLPFECEAGQRPDTVTGDCIPLGTPCPMGNFPEDVEANVFVLAGAMDGDGTQARPFGDLNTAYNAADVGATIMVGPGRYEEMVVVDKAITFLGTCTGQTHWIGPAVTGVVDSDEPESIQGAIHVVEAGHATVKNFTFSGQRTALRVIGGRLDAQDLHIDNVVRTAAHAAGGTMNLDGVWITDPQDDGTGVRGRGVQFEAAVGELNKVVIDRARHTALQILSGSTLTVTDLTIRSTQTNSDGLYGLGILTYESALDVTGGSVENSTHAGVQVSGSNSTLSGRGLFIGGTKAAESGTGHGILVQEGASAAFRETAVRSNEGSGASINDTDSRISFEDAVIFGNANRGVTLYSGHGSLTRTALQFNDYLNLFLGDGTSATLEDLNIQGSIGAVAGVPVNALRLQHSDATITRMNIVATEGVASVVMSGGTVQMEEVQISHTYGQTPDGVGGPKAGFGFLAARGDLIARKLHVSAASLTGMQLGEVVNVQLDGLVVQDTRGEVATREFGNGLVVSGTSGVIEISNFVVAGNHTMGAFLEAALGPVRLRNGLIRDTFMRIRDQQLGIGLGITGSTEVSLSKIRLDNNRVAAIVVSKEEAQKVSKVEMEDVDIRHVEISPFGAQSYGYGLAIQRMSEVKASRLSIQDAGVAGIFLSDPLSLFSTVDLTIADTRKNEDGTMGAGLVVMKRAAASIRRARIMRSSLAGVLLGFGAYFLGDDMIIENVGESKFDTFEVFEKKTYEGVGDGVMVLSRSEVSLSNLQVSGCARAGLTFNDATGTVNRTNIVGNQIGLVTQGLPQPTDIDYGSVFFDANDMAERYDGDWLPVPREVLGGGLSDYSTAVRGQ